jgi:Protein of unknown function (DUF998)
MTTMASQSLTGPAQPATGWLRCVFLATSGMAGVFAGVGYSAFLMAWLAGSRLNMADSFVSELEVAGQPAAGVFRLADVVSALLIVVFAVGFSVWWRPGLLGMLGSFCVLGVGAAAVADAAEPMPCAPSISASCRLRLDQVPLVTQLHQWHTVSSVAGVLCVVLGMLLLGRAFAATGRAGWGRASWATGLAVAALGGAEIPLTFTQHGVGGVERVQVVLVSAWIAGMGWHLYRCATAAGVPSITILLANSGGPESGEL